MCKWRDAIDALAPKVGIVKSLFPMTSLNKVSPAETLGVKRASMTKPDLTQDLSDALARAAARHRGVTAISGLKRQSGGASQEIWAFTAHGVAGATGERAMILRRAPLGVAAADRDTAVPLALEADVQARARDAGVPVAPIEFVLEPQDGLGDGYVMGFVEGETLARKILRDAAFDPIRPKLAAQCGAILARLHKTNFDRLPLRIFGARDQLARYEQIYKSFDDPRPVIDWAFAWLKRHALLATASPEPGAAVLVHGDFRNGNLMFGPEGVRAVLDWELCHLGDGHEDLGWICVNSWRFGEIDKPVGGFGLRDDLFHAYEAAGGAPVDPERVRFWETLGTLKWGIMCMTMFATHKSGLDRSVERATIGRRVSETELDLLTLIA
jgi:aminoglycoside phosphotransferase (APT) family kinase protein